MKDIKIQSSNKDLYPVICDYGITFFKYKVLEINIDDEKEFEFLKTSSNRLERIGTIMQFMKKNKNK